MPCWRRWEAGVRSCFLPAPRIVSARPRPTSTGQRAADLASVTSCAANHCSSRCDARCAGILVKAQHKLRAQLCGHQPNHRVCKARLAAAPRQHGVSGQFSGFKTEGRKSEQTVQHMNALELGIAIAACEHPDQFTQHDVDNHQHRAGASGRFQRILCQLRLFGIVVGDKSNQHVDVDGDHGSRAGPGPRANSPALAA